MNKRYTVGTLAIGLVLMLALATMADVNPTPWSKWFEGHAYYNGQLAPVGSVIDAYVGDIHCGSFTVGQNWDPGDPWDPVGLYGILHAYGDDPYTTDIVEGAESGELITFKLNHRDPQLAVMSGDVFWQDQARATIDLSVNDAIIDLSMTDAPSDRIVKSGALAHVTIGIRNDGNGLDFYTIEATSALGWTLNMPAGFTYAAAGEMVEISFDVSPPVFPGANRVDEIQFAVFSELDPSMRAEGSFTVTIDNDDIYAIELTDPPIAKEGQPDELVQFVVGVRNVGNVNDEYSIEVTSMLGWDVSTDTKAFVNAAPDEEVYLAFEVLIPSDAADAADLLTYTVVSSGDPGVSVGSEVLLTSQTPTDVDDNGVALLPNSLQLAQNYPNPFNPTTTISYTLPSRSRVSLDIYDVLGRVVEHIELGAVSGGTHDVEYNASSLSSGVYFYRLATDFGAETRKMVLLK